LWDNQLLPKSFEQNPMSMPRLQLHQLSHSDYLSRQYELAYRQQVQEVKLELEDLIPRMHPIFSKDGETFAKFLGWARYSSEIESFSIIDIKGANVGEHYPSSIMA